jgi:hypothetical protein
LHLLQPFEIAQNRQRILWKSLEKTGGYLEMFGKKLGGFQAQRRAAARSFAMLGAQRGSSRHSLASREFLSLFAFRRVRPRRHRL